MNFNKKQFTFRPTAQIIWGLEDFFNKYGETIPTKDGSETPTTADLFEAIIKKANYQAENNSESEIIQELKKELESQIETNNHLGAAFTKVQKEANENGQISNRLQFEIDELKSQFENSEIITKELFSPENKFALWQMLQVFKQIYPNWTFENMILFIISSFKENGYLKLDKKDISYLETINHNYNGNL